MEWKEYKIIWKKKELHKNIDRINKEGIHLSKEDISDLFNKIQRDVKKILKRKFDKFIDEVDIYDY